MGHKLKFEHIYLNPQLKNACEASSTGQNWFIAILLLFFVFSTLFNIFSIICPEMK